ncbi:MAG: glycosyltransferase family 9 protein [Chlamydiales bacterium]|nr:glycosyltransferase family 9 protein [Chlamydiales bacterium]
MKERGNKWLKFWDRYLGIPLIALLGFFHKKRSLPKEVERVALLKSAGIGDIVILSGVIQDLEGKEILLFTGYSNAEMGKMLKGIKVIALPMSNPLACLREIRKHQVDVWIDCDPWPRINSLLSLFSHSHYSIGFRTLGQGRHWVYDLAIAHSFERHEIDNYRELIRPLGILKRNPPKVEIPDVPREKRVVVHIFPGGSRADLKKWPQKKWEELIFRIAGLGYQIDLTGGKADRLKLACFSKAQNFAGLLSLRETAEHLKKSTCVISVDTGIMHLAAALGCRVVGLHGPTSPKRWGALGEKVISITPSIAYSPCIQLGFESKCKENHCLKAVTVDQVFDAFLKLTNGLKYENSSPCRRERNAPLALVPQ